MAKRRLRQGYYWPTLESDCNEHVRKCHACQAHAQSIRAPASHLHTIAPPRPFAMWGLNVIDQIHPNKASNGHNFVLAATEYFTKWVEAESLANVTARQPISRNILARFGQGTDNGTNFRSRQVVFADNRKSTIASRPHITLWATDKPRPPTRRS